MPTDRKPQTVREAIHLALGQEPSVHVSNNSEPLAVQVAEQPRVFALLIAINEYKYRDPRNKFENLEGCVADATDVERYLQDKLSVPSTRIQKLYNDRATRRNIKEAFLALTENPNIKRGEPLLIFYAGHGSRAQAPKSWSDESTLIEMILPHDFNFNFEQIKEETAQGIPDITLRILLSKLAAAKGNNITVIFDCCHSGSGTRVGAAPGYPSGLRRRGIDLPEDYQILDTLDADIIPEQTRARGVVDANRDEGAGSHILLAACRPGEIASEYISGEQLSRGIFTKYLVELLNSPGSESLTYRKIIEELPDLHRYQQHPQCEGANNSYALFQGRPHDHKDRRIYRVRKEKHQFILDGGEADGITRNAKFDLFANDDTAGQPLGSAIVRYTGPSHSYVRLDCSMPYPPDLSTLSVVQTHAGNRPDVRISIPLDDAFTPLFRHLATRMEDNRDSRRNIQLVEEGEEADYTLQLVEAHNGGEPQVAFLVGHQICQIYGLRQLHNTVPLRPSVIDSVLSGAAEFYWHLNRTRSSQIRLTERIILKCFRLEEKEDEQLEILDLAPTGDNLVHAGVLTVSNFDDRDDCRSPYYGLTVTNYTKYPLYVAIFYFAMGDLSIVPLYYPPTAKGGSVEPSVLPDGTLTIGFQSAGWAPLQFELPRLANGERAQVDVGYMKAFCSTQYVDFENMTQKSPLEGIRDIKTTDPPPVSGLWDTEDFEVVLRREQ